MSTIKSLLERVSIELTDKERVSWPLDALLSYYNSAIAAIANYRPDIFAQTLTFICVAGTRQPIPAGGIKLIEVERNTGGRKIRFLSEGFWMTWIPSG